MHKIKTHYTNKHKLHNFIFFLPGKLSLYFDKKKKKKNVKETNDNFSIFIPTIWHNSSSKQTSSTQHTANQKKNKKMRAYFVRCGFGWMTVCHCHFIQFFLSFRLMLDGGKRMQTFSLVFSRSIRLIRRPTFLLSS